MKGLKKCLKLLGLSLFAALSWVFISCSFTYNANAVTIDSLLATQASYTKNFDPTVLYYNRDSVGVPITSLLVQNPTGVWDFSQNFVFTNPYTDKTGKGFTQSVRFTLTSYGPYANENLTNLMANSKLGFENINVDSAYCSQSWQIISLSDSYVRIQLQSSCPNGTWATNQNFQNVLVSINFSPDSMFWCANDNADPNRQCPSAFSIQLSDIEYYFALDQSNTDSLLQQQVNQNQTIIDNQNETNDWLKDDTPPDVDSSSIGGASGWLPAGPVDSLLTLPMTFAQGIVDIFTGQHQCSPIVLPFDFINASITIPCLDSFFTLSGVNLIWNGVGTIIAAFVLYDTFKWLYKFVDDTLTLRENNSGLWGGL